MDIFYFVILLGVIVTIHELGHFLVAKAFNVYCSEFAIGMGPKLFSIQGKETKYSIRLLPIGGFVQMAGEAETALEGVCPVNVPHERTIKGISHPKQIAIMLAGIVMNFLLAFVLFVGIFSAQGIYQQSETAQIGSVIQNSPAEIAGFQANDLVLSVTYGDEVFYPEVFSDLVKFNVGKEELQRIYEVQRGTEVLKLTVTPTLFEEQNAYLIGINALQEHRSISFVESVQLSISTMIESSTLIFDGLVDLLRGNNLDQLSGPVGIFTITAQEASQGLINYLWLIAMFSLNIGILNALPLPILDGGRAILSVVEMVRGKPINQKLENALMGIGMALLLSLMIFATWQDISRIIFG